MIYKLVLLFLFLNGAFAVLQKLTLYDKLAEERAMAEGFVFRKRYDSDIACKVDPVRSYCWIGMWNYLSTNNASHTIPTRLTEGCANFTAGREVLAVRPLGGVDSTITSITLYERPVYNTTGGGFAPGHYINETGWTGSVFPTGAMAMTGISNWTLFENPDYISPAWCIVGTSAFQRVDTFDGNYPARVGSILRGCFSHISYTNTIKIQDF